MSRADFKQFDERDTAFRNSKGKVKAAPGFAAGVRIADTHCHLNMLGDPAFAIARAAHHGVRFICSMTDPSEHPHSPEEDSTFSSAADSYAALGGWLAEARDVLDAWGEVDTPLPVVRCASGVHPHNAKRWETSRDELERLLADPLTCCLGEIGLDYHYDLSPRDVQREVFATQLRLAHRTGLPVSLHLREAHDDALAILEAEGVPQAGCVLHCFNLDAETLAPFLDLGCHIALGGPLTFRKSWYTRLACLDVPYDRLLTETDAPYMAPEPLRGTVCEPAQTAYTLRMLLDCHGYAGIDRAIELVQPRPIDIENGELPPSLDELPDLEAMHTALDERGFADLVFRNAVELLDREPTRWQGERS